MSSIPLPALDIRPPAQQPDPLEQYGRLMALKNQQTNAPLQTQALQQQVQSGQLENQQRQQQLTDQQATTKALQGWDGKDYNDLYPLILKNGGSAQAVLGLKQKALEQQVQLSTAAKNNGDAAQAQYSAAKTKGDLLDGALSPLVDPKQVPDDQLPAAINSTAQDLIQKGILDPQHGQMAQQIAQLGDPAKMREQIDLLRKSNMAQSQILEDAAKTAGINKDVAATGEANAHANQINTEMQNGGTQAMADSKYRNILMAQKLGQSVSPVDQAFKSAYERQKTLVPTATFNMQNAGVQPTNGQPSALASAVANGQMKWGDVISPRTPMSVKQQFANEVKAINPNFNSGDYTVEQKAREAFTSGNYSQQLNSIDTAREHMKTFTSLANALDNGDVQALNAAGNAIGMQFGSDKATNFNIAKQAFSAEVAKAFSGAGVTEGDRKEIGDKISSASSPAQLKGAAATADALLAGKQAALQQTYKQSQQGTPNFGNQQTAPARPPNVPSNYVWNAQGNNGRGSWRAPQ